MLIFNSIIKLQSHPCIYRQGTIIMHNKNVTYSCHSNKAAAWLSLAYTVSLLCKIQNVHTVKITCAHRIVTKTIHMLYSTSTLNSKEHSDSKLSQLKCVATLVLRQNSSTIAKRHCFFQPPITLSNGQVVLCFACPCFYLWSCLLTTESISHTICHDLGRLCYIWYAFFPCVCTGVNI